MRSKLLHLLLLILPLLAQAQERHAVKGRVYYANLGVKDVLVVNNNAQVETRTDSLGNFTINAKVGDLIILSDFKIETKKIRYTPDLIKNGLMLLEVKMVAEEIEEVVINRSTITSESLGIPMGKSLYRTGAKAAGWHKRPHRDNHQPIERPHQNAESQCKP
jgi:hypothetical protein